MLQFNVKRTIKRFTDTIDGLDLALVESMNTLLSATKAEHKELEFFISNGLELSEQDSKKQYRFRHGLNGVPAETDGLMDSYKRFYAAKKNLERMKAAYNNLPASFFLSLTGSYNDYLTTLASALFCLRSESTPMPEPVSTLEEPKECGPAEKSHDVLDAKCESVAEIRYAGQIAWLESKFGVDLQREFKLSVEFAELMECRASLVGHEGTASARYLEFCRQHGFPVDYIHVGDPLNITADYFSAARDVIYGTGVKLGYLLWRAVLPDQIAKANGALQDIAFGLIQDHRYKLARDLLQFAKNAAYENADQNNRHVFLINGALAAYLDGDKQASNKMLGMEDWTATADILKLAHSVLSEQFQEAATLMRKIGNSGRPSKGEYLRWPLFTKFRATPEFTSAFEDTFGCITLNEAEIQLPL